MPIIDIQKMKIKHWTLLLIGLIVLMFLGLNVAKKICCPNNFSIGQKIDSLNGVYVYYNGNVDNASGRNKANDGYNLGQKYQCVEFVKRYYYLHLKHKMPNSYGNAIDFFDKTLADGEINKTRDLFQFINPSNTKPKENDLLIYNETIWNKYGHVAIISKVENNKIEIIQQNPGPNEKSRKTFFLDTKNGKWEIGNNRILGWLRKG